MNTFQHPANDRHEGVHWFEDADSGLRAIIAIHSTPPGSGRRRMPGVALSQRGGRSG
jgi:leucine dehydrogenase